jgi:hypothetical protein
MNCAGLASERMRLDDDPFAAAVATVVELNSALSRAHERTVSGGRVHRPGEWPGGQCFPATDRLGLAPARPSVKSTGNAASIELPARA